MPDATGSRRPAPPAGVPFVRFGAVLQAQFDEAATISERPLDALVAPDEGGLGTRGRLGVLAGMTGLTLVASIALAATGGNSSSGQLLAGALKAFATDLSSTVASAGEVDFGLPPPLLSARPRPMAIGILPEGPSDPLSLLGAGFQLPAEPVAWEAQANAINLTLILPGTEAAAPPTTDGANGSSDGVASNPASTWTGTATSDGNQIASSSPAFSPNQVFNPGTGAFAARAAAAAPVSAASTAGSGTLPGGSSPGSGTNQSSLPASQQATPGAGSGASDGDHVPTRADGGGPAAGLPSAPIDIARPSPLLIPGASSAPPSIPIAVPEPSALFISAVASLPRSWCAAVPGADRDTGALNAGRAMDRQPSTSPRSALPASPPARPGPA